MSPRRSLHRAACSRFGWSGRSCARWLNARRSARSTRDIKGASPWLLRMRGSREQYQRKVGHLSLIEDIQAAQGRISGETIRTPLVLSAAASDRARMSGLSKVGEPSANGFFQSARCAQHRYESNSRRTRAGFDLRQLGKSRPWIGLCGKAFWSPLCRGSSREPKSC